MSIEYVYNFVVQIVWIIENYGVCREISSYTLLMFIIIAVYEKAKKVVQFKENSEANSFKNEPEDVKIDEPKIDRLLHLLHEADPTNPEKDTEEMLNLESMY